MEMVDDNFDFIIRPFGDGNYYMVLTQPENPLQILRDSEGRVAALDINKVARFGAESRLPHNTEDRDRAMQQGSQRQQARNLLSSQAEEQTNIFGTRLPSGHENLRKLVGLFRDRVAEIEEVREQDNRR